MSVKVISSDKKSIKLEVVINYDENNFLQTEDNIMNEVNEIGKKATQKAMENLDIKEKTIIINEQKLYQKKNPKYTKVPMEK